MLPTVLEVVVGCQDVVDPPQAGGDPVGQKDIYAVVTPGQEEEDNTQQAGQERGPMEECKSCRRICRKNLLKKCTVMPLSLHCLMTRYPNVRVMVWPEKM